MNKKQIKKAFTLVELLVVIAILALLGSVGIIGYTSFIKKGHISNDESLITQWNTLLDGLDLVEDDPSDVIEAKLIFSENNYSGDFLPETSDFHFYWDISNDNVYLVNDVNDGFEVVFPEDTTALQSNCYRLDKEYTYNDIAIKTAPINSDSTFDGSSKSLINTNNAETLDGWTLVYALGDENSATGEFSTTIPTASDAGTYYVWYKAVNDEDSTKESEAKKLEVKISTIDANSTEPSAKEDLVFNGQDQDLVTAGSNQNGHWEYAIDTGDFSSITPKATNVGTYLIYYKFVGANNYNNIDAKSFGVTIAKKDATINTDNVIKSYTYTGLEQTVDSGATVDSGGTLTYSDNTFTDVPSGGKQTITINAAETDNYNAASTTVEITINKAGQTAPAAPQKASATSSSVTLQAISTSGQGSIKYGYNTTDTAPSTWKDDVEFTDLEPETTYYFFAKYEGTTNYNEAISTGTAITTPASITWSPLSTTITTNEDEQLTVNYLPVFADNSVPANITFAYKDGETYITIENPTMSSLATYANAGTLYYTGTGTLVAVRSVNDISWNDTFKTDGETSYLYYASTSYSNLQEGIKTKIANDGSETVEKVSMETSGEPDTMPTINGATLGDIWDDYKNGSSGFGGSNGNFWSNVNYDSDHSFVYDANYLVWMSEEAVYNHCVLFSRTFN